MKSTIFPSYFDALAHVLGKLSNHYFTASEFVANDNSGSGNGFQYELDEHPSDEPLPAEVASTLVDYAANNGTVAGVEIAVGDAHMGYILMHYTDNGDIVRFVAFQ